MTKITPKLINKLRRKNRIRKVVNGTTERPRLTIFISNTNVSAQIIDDSVSKTLISVTTVSQKSLEKSNMTDKAVWAGQEVAKKAKTKKIDKVVLDRNGKLYHGRVKALADAARESGLEI